ncbi:CLUMA_CG010884, isoform A [Clunio marinus]|uniref:CLUMA_CG010884, isoform A n=1 Tax=Clunio marinus TaxID=568069 RepID=A0A1J1IB28_9DIPT|nr:CLUMA_CG010884, isoform A [Clunio marinus]
MASTEFENVLKKTITPEKCRESLIGSEYLSDVKFTLGDSMDELRAHKFFLMTSSPVFHKLFTTHKLEDGTIMDLKISEISKLTMIEICRYAYTGNPLLNRNNMIDILQAATKLEMKFLIEKTIDFMCKEIDPDHVFKVLNANKGNNMRINMKCFDYIEKNHKACFQSSDFLHISSELLHTIMQTCKIPKAVASNALTKWSSFLDNHDEDLEELIALMSLKEDVPDKSDVKAEESDTESVSSRTSSRAGQKSRVRNRQQNNNGKANPAKKAVNQASLAEKVNLQQKKLTENSAFRNLSFICDKIERKKFKFANLDLVVVSKPIFITEIHFIYDLNNTDGEFLFQIKDMTNNPMDLFYDRVRIDKNEFNRYVLPRPCRIDGEKKIWISIEFPHAEFRMTLGHLAIRKGSNTEFLGLRRRSQSASGNVISTVVFKEY